MDKPIASVEEAVARIPDGATIMMGGFGLCGIPENLIAELYRQGTRDLTVISNNAGVDEFGIGLLLKNKQIKKIVASYVGENKTFERLAIDKTIDVELNPQGTLAERIRAGGAGIPAFFTATGYGTIAAEGLEVREIAGRNYVLVPSIRAQFAFIKAWQGDRWGNLRYRKTAGNFNPMMATAADVVIAEVEELVELGSLDPNTIDTPSVVVDAIFQGSHYQKRIERRVVRSRSDDQAIATPDKRHLIARRAALELRDGDCVNLGIGLPTLVTNFLPPGIEIILQSENGTLGVGPPPFEGEEDADMVNAGKETVSEIPGTAYLSSADSFALIRGGHIDVSILGALEVDAGGTLANWAIPGKMLKGMGGAMDLVAGAARIIVAMEHTTREGNPRIVNTCSLPLTGTAVVNRIITELGVMDITPSGLVVRELAPGVSFEDIQRATEPRLTFEPTA